MATFREVTARAVQAGWSNHTLLEVIGNWWEGERDADLPAWIESILDAEEKTNNERPSRGDTCPDCGIGTILHMADFLCCTECEERWDRRRPCPPGCRQRHQSRIDKSYCRECREAGFGQ